MRSIATGPNGRRLAARGLVVFLTASAALTGCASARRFVAPAPMMAPDTVAALTGWVQPATPLSRLHFTADASISTPDGQVFGGLAAESFATGSLEGARYHDITLSSEKVFACADHVVVVEGSYRGMAADSGAAYPVKGPFLMRAIVDAEGVAHTNLVRLSTTRGVRAGSLADDCAAPATYHFAHRSLGIVVFPAGLATTQMPGNTIDELKFAGWSCPSPDLCRGGRDPASAGFLAEAYTRLRPGWGLQLVGGRLWKMTARGYRVADHPLRSGPVALHATVDMAAVTAYIERRYFRFAAGPGLVRSSWSFDSGIPRADSLGFNGATAAAVKPALVGTGSLVLPIGSRMELEVTAVGDATPSSAPPSILEFQPGGIPASGILFAIGLGIRP